LLSPPARYQWPQARHITTFTPGEQAIISFHFNGPTSLSNRTPNILVLLPGGGLGYHETSTTYSLYDGNNLLGSVTRTGDSSFNGQAFRSFDNPFSFYLVAPSVPVDYSTILSGQITGRIVYTPHYTNPDPSDYAHLEFELLLLQQTGLSGGLLTMPPIIDGVQIVAVPEPRIALLITFLIAVFNVARRIGQNPRSARTFSRITRTVCGTRSQ
jgi:hypothetical protein